MFVIAIATALFLLMLVCEARLHERRRMRLPLCIAVTGTRGKSGVVRMLTAVLREGGRRTLARTSGSRPMILLPDGSEREIRRRGPASIIEQKAVVREAVRRNVDVVVAEIMSLHPECHRVEAGTLLQPEMVVLTNVRRDHLEAMGETEEEIAGVLALDAPPGATLFVPEAEEREIFRAAAEEGGGRLVSVPTGSAGWLENTDGEPVPGLNLHFAENLELVCALAAELGIDRAAISRGLARTTPDPGALGIWRWAPDDDRTVWLVNAFAANDPDSTYRVLTRIRELLSPAAGGVTGLLSLRPDRGERTRQWVTALAGEFADCFNDLWLCGLHARAVRARLGRGQLLIADEPARMTRAAAAHLPDGGILFGCGNIGGPGEQLAEYWQAVGEPFVPATGATHGL